MQPNFVLTPVECAEDFSLLGRCAAASVEDAQCVIRVAGEDDVIERFALPRCCLEDRISFA